MLALSASRLLLPLLVPAGAAVGLASYALVGPDAIGPVGARVLAGVGALALGAAAWDATRRQSRLEERLEDLAWSARQALGSERTGRPPLDELPGSVAALASGYRAQRREVETDRALDHAMVRETPNGLLLIDAQGRVRRHNPAFALLMPVQGDPVGRTPIETIAVPELQEVIDETSRTRQPSERTANVGRREVLVRAIPLAVGEGCLGVVLDITTVRQAEKARRDFVANVSHELRTPVTAVVGYAESLLQDRDELPAWSHPMIEAIDRNARRLGALIEDVLHLSKIEARRSDLRLERLEVRPLVEQVLARFEIAARPTCVRLELAPGPALEADVNVQGFDHALGNLVDNAIKYSPAGARVLVMVEDGGGAVLVRVTDEGVGIDPVHHERVFERFYRVDPGRSRDVGGTGLGLALVKHLCLAMGAEVTLESAPGRGSRFTLRLPRAAARGASA